MRLLFIIDCLGSGGSQRQMVNLAVGLKRRGHEIAFFLYHPGYDFFASSLDQNGIFIYSCRKQRRFSVGPIFALSRIMRKWHWDAALSFLPTPNLYAEVARLGLKSFRLVVSERSTYSAEGLSIGRLVLEQMHHLADHITVNSHHQRLLMENAFPWMRGRLSTIYNGVDLDEFTLTTPLPHSAESGLKLLALGSVLPEKNALGLIQALAHYRQGYGGRFTVRWAGKVSTEDRSKREFERAKQLLEKFSLVSQWEWLGERKDVASLLRECDALIHPSFFEGLPNTICEALASGRPVLASNVCDNARLVEEGITGFLFNPADPSDIAHAIRKLDQLSHEDFVTMAQQGRSFADRELSLEVYCDHYERLFEYLVRGGQNPLLVN